MCNFKEKMLKIEFAYTLGCSRNMAAAYLLANAASFFEYVCAHIHVNMSMILYMYRYAYKEGVNMGHHHHGHGHDHSGGHHHHHHHTSNKKALLGAFIVITLFMIVEVIGGLWTNSLALLSDAGHMLSDAAALGLSLYAVWLGFLWAAIRKKI